MNPVRPSEYDSLNVMIIEVRPWGVHLADWLTGFELVSVCAGPSGELYALAVAAPADYREVAPSGANFPKIGTENSHDVRVIRFDGANVTQFDIPAQHFNFSFVQPLPENEILLVGARTRRYTDETYDLNAHIYGEDGHFRRAFLLGDGVADVQATSDGRIWTSYFDEGVYGNFGWVDPVGAPGLLLWDRFGIRLYEYEPPKGAGPIDDCYYLNVASDTEAWCYYYSSYPLVRIRNGAVDAVWRDMHGTQIVTAWDDSGIFLEEDVYYLYDLPASDVRVVRAVIQFTDESGRVLEFGPISGRGSMIYLIRDGRYHFCDMRAFLREH